MFDSLQKGLNSAFKSLTGKAKLTEGNMRDGLKLVEQSLLEADVNVTVVRDFIGRVTEQAIGAKVIESLRPTEQLVGIVHQELINLMGPVDHSLHLRGDLTILMMCGLQGSGKTTSCGKLAKMLLGRGKKPMLVAADLQRPAAIEQLKILGAQLGVPVYSEPGQQDPVIVCQNGVKQAKQLGAQVLILDTAGRLHIDDELMEQLKRIDRRCEPDQVYLVVDGMTGQDAVNSAKAFNEALELDGVIMTKLDGDARGGAALSVKAVTGVPLKFMGTGEQLDALEEFHPDRMAGRILGMGDMLTLIETAQQKVDQDEMAKQEERLRQGKFTLEDFRKMLEQTKKMGSFSKLLGMIPGMGQIKDMMGDADAEGDMRRIGGIINSMTPDERRNPTKTIDMSRRRRIAAGAGVEASEVSGLIKQFDGMAQLMTSMASMGMRERMSKISQLQQGGMMNPGAALAKEKAGTGKRLTAEERKKLQKQREKEFRKRKRESEK
ncbi:MAG: signal recognition particle protein [Planctomycetia bacterium]|nr:signal recognition particle protein [Planctomycetia bacterium]